MVGGGRGGRGSGRGKNKKQVRLCCWSSLLVVTTNVGKSLEYPSGFLLNGKCA